MIVVNSCRLWYWRPANRADGMQLIDARYVGLWNWFSSCVTAGTVNWCVLWRVAGCAFAIALAVQPSRSQPSVATQETHGFPLPLQETWWTGSYNCAQGLTGLHLRISPTAAGSVEAMFQFGAGHGSQDIPSGSFLLKGALRNDGFLELDPVQWVSRPPGYVMVGLAGFVSGRSYRGHIIGGVECGQISLEMSEVPVALPSRPANQGPLNSVGRPTLIPIQGDGGTFTVPVTINNRLTLDFIIDSGASDVAIPADVVLTLMRTGTISKTDFLGSQIYQLADGSRIPSQTFRIRLLRVGDRVLRDVSASIAPVQGGLLLGQSFLSRFSSWSIDNQRHVLVLE
jgi:gag-polyprotein putative aspartyl protease